jgi:hypothetical protein
LNQLRARNFNVSLKVGISIAELSKGYPLGYTLVSG